jgi:hypothetical protein
MPRPAHDNRRAAQQRAPRAPKITCAKDKEVRMANSSRHRLGQTTAVLALSLSFAVLAPPASGDDTPTISVTIKDHRFEPAEIRVPQGEAVVLKITNTDPTPEEFDSSALKIEKVIAGGTYGTVRLRPLGPGRYPFMGEFHSDTAQGVVISE